MKKPKKRFRLIPQVVVLFLISILVTGVITYLTQRRLSDDNIVQQTETLAASISAETVAAIEEYPAHEWLLTYWYKHADELDIEYDAEFWPGTQTEKKCRILQERYPDLSIRYVTSQQLGRMPEEDRKLYAEITYSWLITRMNQIKRTYRIDFLFCVVALDDYQSQFFLLSAADPGAKRGRNYEDVYPLGTVVSVGESQREAMRSAEEHFSHLADAGQYVDYYTWLGKAQGNPVFIGMTYSLADLKASAARQARTETQNAMLYQVVLCFVSLALISKVVLRPLGRVQKNIRLYKETKDSKTVTENLAEIRSLNEIGELADDFSELATEMDDYIDRIETITAEKERIGTELALATRIQASMMPHDFPPFPERGEFDVYASMDPAKEVGGDFYDFFLVDDDHLCVVIADVSGKGIPAALFMMASKIILQSCAMLGGSPAEILTKTNEAICSNNQEEMFLTVWLGILEISTGRLRAANTGHEYPVLKETADGEFALVKDRHGFVIGGMEGLRYKEYDLQLQPGSKLFLYTDGVPEATDADGNMFGTGRMLEALNISPSCPPKETLQNVREAVDAFVKDAEQFDDLTMLCLAYRGADGNGDQPA